MAEVYDKGHRRNHVVRLTDEPVPDSPYSYTLPNYIRFTHSSNLPVRNLDVTT
jgi:hypothetical protein